MTAVIGCPINTDIHFVISKPGPKTKIASIQHVGGASEDHRRGTEAVEEKTAASLCGFCASAVIFCFLIRLPLTGARYRISLVPHVLLR